ncbi:MAG: AMP-binding protein [Carbonactinosporaceae bacterium]
MSNPYDEKPWLAWYASGVAAALDFPSVPLTRILDDAADSWPRRKALIFLGRAITYRQLVRMVDRFAGALKKLGVVRGDRVALILPNCPQNVIAFYAVLRLGAVVVQHNPLYTESELRHQLSDSGAKVVIVFDKAYERLAAAQEGTQVRHVIVTSLIDYLPRLKQALLKLPLEKAQEKRELLGEEIPPDAPVLHFDELLESDVFPARQARVDAQRDLALLQYTGGTTGRPKGAMLTHYNLVANAHQTKSWDPAMRPGRETTLAVLPLFHAYGLTLCLTTTILCGGTLVLLPAFDLDLVFQAVDKWKPTIFPGVPPMYSQIIDHPKVDKHDLESIRTCVSGAMRLPPEIVDRFQKATGGGHLVEGYGLTETSPVALANPLNANARAGTVGLPISNTQARVVDEFDIDPEKICPVGVAGELLVRGPQVFHGYWNQPEDSAAMLSDDGWCRTGDIAVMSPSGFFTVIDRKRDVIMASGFSIYPSEIEDVVRSHPAVHDAAVIGIPDDYRGETVKTCVMLREGQQLTEEELIEHCSQHLAPYKIPKVVEFREELPRNLIGKVLRRILREEHEQAMATAEPSTA